MLMSFSRKAGDLYTRYLAWLPEAVQTMKELGNATAKHWAGKIARSHAPPAECAKNSNP